MRSEFIVGHVPGFAVVGAARAAPPLPRAKLMCEVLRDMIRRRIGPEPPSARLDIELRSFNGFDTYVVVCHYEKMVPAAEAYVLGVRRARQANWDDYAWEQLQKTG